MQDHTEHINLINRFYTAFQARDAQGMIACYHDDVRFSDPVFPALEGAQVGHMWTMLCARGKDLTLTFDQVKADEQQGSAHWEATYTFSGSGRKVHNVIDARFGFSEGKIILHTDHFDLWRWSRMALGVPGICLGWTPLVKNKIRKTAQQGLDQWIAKQDKTA